MEKSEKQTLETEMIDFLSLQGPEVPPKLSAALVAEVHQDLHPSRSFVFGKMALIHLGVGFLTLLFCPQFGLSWTSSAGIMPLLMKYGDDVCMLGCGGLFVGLSLLIVSFVLRPEEIRILKNNAFLQVTALSALSLGLFICAGAKILLSLGLMWGLGAIFGGSLSLDIGWRIRLWNLKRKLA